MTIKYTLFTTAAIIGFMSLAHGMGQAPGLSAINVPTKPDGPPVTVQVPCTRVDASGTCIEWSGKLLGCAGMQTGCSARVTSDIMGMPLSSPESSCTAAPGQSCTANAPLRMVGIGKYVPVEIPCLTQDMNGKCVQWGAKVSGCKAPQGGSCNGVVVERDFSFQCTVQNGESCTTQIQIRN